MKLTKRLTTGFAGLVILAASVAPVNATSTKTERPIQRESLCESHLSLCTDPYTTIGEDGYVGHDEPSVMFKSSVPGSGNDITYQVTLPKDPKQKPKNDGSGGTWNFQLRPTFWFGLTLCDTESAPEYTKECKADSDKNDLVGLDPTKPDFIGKHPGNAYMELQFYGPGYVPQFEGFGCSATQYCAAMTIDSLTLDQATGIGNNADCDNYLLGGIEPINWAYVTRSGKSQAPANPLFTGTFDAPDLSAVTPDYKKDLMMNPGDRITIHMHDTRAGLRIDISDQTTHQSGSMTASKANGFGHILYEPDSDTCHMEPYAFHPEYSTGNPRGNTWSAHTYNVAYSDEIGHFENCLELDADFNCAVSADDEPGGAIDGDDAFCVPAEDSLLIKINGCFLDDEDFDGPSYQKDWPGTDPNVRRDQRSHPSPVMFTSPLINGKTNYSRVVFEADLPRIEASDSQLNPPFCDRTTGENCVNPPAGAAFYPIFTTRMLNGTCTWQEGGRYLPGTINDFGGTSTSEYGPLLLTPYQATGNTIVYRYNNFQNDLGYNPCRNTTRHDHHCSEASGRRLVPRAAAPPASRSSAYGSGMTRILVTGGAGYVGSVSVEAFLAAGHEVVVLDDLTTGHRAAVTSGATLRQGTYADQAATTRLLAEDGIEAILHCAARSLVGESIVDPSKYYRDNVAGGVALLEAARAAGVGRIVFSSTAAVYGVPDATPIPEDAPLRPINPYGESKRTFEEALRWYGNAYGLRSVSLRYFNVAGATDSLGEAHDPETHLIPNVLAAADGATDLTIFGDDYPTPDGTCLRDYIHVADLADAHLRAIEATAAGDARTDEPLVCNLGNGGGFSIREVVSAAEAVVGSAIPVRIGPRRAGDPPVLVARSTRAAEVLGWRPERPSLEAMVGSAWAWRRAHPGGYGE